MTMTDFLKLTDKIKDFYTSLKLMTKHGRRWIDNDGLINIETSSLLMILFMKFFPVLWSIIFSLIVVCSKSCIDKSNGSQDEEHDLICCTIGIIIGFILVV